MIPRDQMIPDPLKDACGHLLKKLSCMPRFTREYSDTKRLLLQELQKRGYIAFNGDPNRYHVQRVGSSYLYKVPATKQGHLKIFRGQLIRILVFARSGGRISRFLMAGRVEKD